MALRSCTFRHVPFILIIIVGISALASCAALFRTEPPLTALLPRDTDLPGWTRETLIEVSGQGRLATMETRYHRGVRALARARYRSSESGLARVTVDAIRCESTLDCLGLVSTEQSEEAAAPWCGTRSWQRKGVIIASRGDLALRLSLEPADVITDLSLFRETLCRILDTGTGVEHLPDDFLRIAGDPPFHGVQYFPSGHPAVPCLAPVVLRLVDHEGRHRVIFFGFPDENRQEYEIFSCLWRTRPPFLYTRIVDMPGAIRGSSGGPITVLAAHKKWFFGVINAETIDEGNREVLRLRDVLTGPLPAEKRQQP